MANEKFAIDFDSSFTNIYKLGSGLVLSEPTVAAVSECEKAIVKAIGQEASKLIGKTTKNTKTVFPVFEGEIVNEKVATELLSGFLKKVCVNKRFSNLEAVFSVPCGIDAKMLDKYKNVAKNCGFSKYYFVEAPILSALGQRIPLSDSKPFFVIDMSGGTTNIAAVSLDGVIAGVSINIGSNKISADIIDFIADRYGLQIGLLTAEKLKNEIGSLDIKDGLATVINGRSIKTGTPMSLNVKACDLFEPVKDYYDKIAEIAMSVLKKLPPEVSAEVHHSGVYIGGQGSLVYGLEKYYSDIFDMQINIAQNGKMAVALGGGAVLADNDLRKKIELNVK
jgi:rod shape-determining protein MreB